MDEASSRSPALLTSLCMSHRMPVLVKYDSFSALLHPTSVPITHRTSYHPLPSLQASRSPQCLPTSCPGYVAIDEFCLAASTCLRAERREIRFGTITKATSTIPQNIGSLTSQARGGGG